MQTEEEKNTLYILAQIDEIQGNTLDFVGKLFYVKKMVEKDSKIFIGQIKEQFPDGTLIGPWWNKIISSFIQKMKETPFEMQTKEDQIALYLLAQIDEIQGNTLDFFGKLLYVKRMVERNPKITIGTTKDQFPDGTIIGPWWRCTVSKFIEKMKETPIEMQTEEEKTALYILAQIDELQGNTLDFTGRLLYVKKMVEKDPKVAISTTKERFPDGTLIGPWWNKIISSFIQKMKETPFEMQTKEDQIALYLLAQIDELQGNTLDFVGRLLYVKKLVEKDSKIFIGQIKDQFPDGTVIGSWWRITVSKFVKRMNDTPLASQTEEDKRALQLIEEIYEILAMNKSNQQVLRRKR